MKNHKYQQINVRLNVPGEAVRFSAETDKQYARVHGIFISMKNDSATIGTQIGLKLNGQEVFDDAHEVRLLSCGNQVAPNRKFFLFEERLEGGGSSVEGKITDGGTLNESYFPIDVRIYLWLMNEKCDHEKSL